MKIEVESVSPVEKSVTIEVDPDRVVRELDRAYAGLGRRVKLRGFRPGKAPRKVLERHFRAEIEAEVAEKVVQSTFSEAVDKEGIEIVAPPRVSITEGIAAGKPLRYMARVEVKPKLSPRDYKGLEITRRTEQVTDESVSSEIAKLRESMAELVPVEERSEAREGDFAVVDYEGTIDGKPFEGSSAQGVTVRVVAGEISEGKLAALEGVEVGKAVEVDQTFSQEHRIEALRGKTARMSFTLKALKTRKLPEIDDGLVRSLGMEGVETVEQLRARMRTELERREARRAEDELRDNLLKAALAKNEFEVPPALVERAVDAMIEGAVERFARRGVDVRKLDFDYSRMRAELRDQALFQVRARLLLDAIAEAEKVTVTDEDLQAEIGRVAEDLGIPLAKAEAQMRGEEAREALKTKIREDKAIAVMSSAANVQTS